MATFPLYNTDTDPKAEILERTEVPYTYQQICDMLPELDLEETLLLQQLIFQSVVGYLVVYNTSAMIGLFLMLTSSINCLKDGYRMDFSHEAFDEEDEDEESDFNSDENL